MFRRLLALFCRHRVLCPLASTAARLSDRGNIDVAVTVCCPKCGRRWSVGVRARCEQAWANRDGQVRSIGG